MQMDPEVNTNNNKESNNYIARKYLVMKKKIICMSFTFETVMKIDIDKIRFIFFKSMAFL